MDTPPPATPPPGAVFELAERAVEFVRRTLGVALDYTPDTLPVLDHYLGQVPREETALVELVTTTAGAYFGEVVRRALGGTWKLSGESPAGWQLITTGDVVFSPVGMAAEAIAKSDLEDFDGTFEIPSAERAQIEEALSEREVPEDEYYSLCGRLEALTYVVDLVVVARSQKNKN